MKLWRPMAFSLSQSLLDGLGAPEVVAGLEVGRA